MATFPELKDGKPTGRWLVKVRVNGAQVRRIAQSSREAKRLEAELIANGMGGDAEPTTAMTFGQLLDKAGPLLWQDTKDEVQSRQRLATVIELIGPAKPLEALSKSVVDDLAAAMRKQGWSNGTRNRHTAALSKALKWAMDRDYLSKMPKLEFLPEPRKRFAWLTVEDQKRLTDWLEDPLNVRGDLGLDVALIVRVLVFTGMRISELLGLEPKDIDLDNEVVFLWGDRTKTSLDRSQPLPKKALGEPLMALVAKGLPSYAGIQGVLYRARDALGLDPALTIHALRHTTATRLALGGHNALVVMSYMGHNSIETTKRYTHINDAAKMEAGRSLMLDMGLKV